MPLSPARTLRIVLHDDGDDFTVLTLLPDGPAMTLLELEHCTAPCRGTDRMPRLGSLVRAVVEALRRSGQREFIFDPADPTPMYLSQEWVLGARQALEDAMWFMERAARIAEARKRGAAKLGWEVVHASILVKVVEGAKKTTWVCPDCGQSVGAFEEFCATATCHSGERYLRCTGNPPLRVVESARVPAAAKAG